jgi:hypothetical protein
MKSEEMYKRANSYVSRRFKISVKRVNYDEKFGGDTCYAEIYKGQELVGQVFRNSYLNKVRGVDLRAYANDHNDRRAYFYADQELPLEEQITDAINNTIFIIGKNDLFFKSIPE